jgi:SAM-dependent methyltransferase
MDPFYLRFFPEYDADILEEYLTEVEARMPQSGRVLDLGCGENAQLARFRTEQREVWGADFHEHPRLAQREWFRRMRPDGGIPFPDASFDLVAACWVLEHVARPVPFLAEVSRVLRPGGRFVAVTPNGHHYATWFIRLFEVLPHRLVQRAVNRLYGRAQHDTFRTYYRLNTARRLTRAASPAGLRLERLVGFPNPDYFAFFGPLRRAAVVTDYLLEQARPGMGQLYQVCTLHKLDPEAAAQEPQAA